MAEDKSEGRKEKSPIEKLQQDLYSRDKPPVIDEERYAPSSKPVDGVKGTWSSTTKPVHKPKKKRKFVPKILLTFNLLKKVLILATVFFVLAIAVAVFVIRGGINLVSTQNVELEVSGLTIIEGGEELALDIALKNGNRVALENVFITVEYPSGARDALNVNKTLTRQEEQIDKVSAKGEASRTFRSVLFGEQNSVKSIRISAEYKTEGSEAVFTREEIYEVVIRSSPVNITLSAPQEINAGQELSLNLEVSSNSTSPVKDLRVSLDFPVGFTLLSATPTADFENRVWKIENLEPRDIVTINIKGRLDGAVNEEKPFRAVIGSPHPDNDQAVGVEFISAVESVVIQKPFINLAANINGSLSGDYVGRVDERIRVDIDWANNLPIDLSDVSLEATLQGSAFPRASVSVNDRGFYRSLDNTVVWNKNTFKPFFQVRPGQSGTLSFAFKTSNEEWATSSRLREGLVTLSITMKGTRFLESRPPETVFATISRVVKIQGDLSLDAETVYSVGPFVNFGPIPPKAEQPTTYTVTWSAKNTYNNVENAFVTASLPVYVEWLGKISPSGEGVIYNPLTRTVAWNVGNLNSWTGFLSNPRQVSFQVSLLPSLSHLGSSPVLVNNPYIIGTDKFTLTDISETNSSLTTKITTDPIYSSKSGVVTR
jgi:hypothetical protein